LFQNEFMRTAVLPPCVYCNEWDITGDKLNLLVHQRSCDVPLGLPFNVTQYAVFQMMMAHVAGLEPGTLSYSIKDAHIYVNQLEMMKNQLTRWNMYQRMSIWNKRDLIARQLQLNDLLEKAKFKLNEEELNNIDSELRIIDMILEPATPELWLNPNINSFFDFDNSKKLKDVKIKNYKHMGKLSIPITQ